MIFKALPVTCGDAFLLKCQETLILVDGGKNQKDIIKILDKEKIPNCHINLLICTHYDADHINGIIGILRSKKYSFDELWLPEILGSITYTLTSKTYEIVKYLKKLNELDKKNYLRDNEEHQQIQIETIDDSWKLIDNENLSYWIKKNIPCSDYIHDLAYRNKCNLKMITNLKKILRLIHFSINSGSKIRWFRYVDYITNTHYGYDMYPKNAIQTKITSYTPTDFFKILYLTTINKESLVFLFQKESLPNVLFCADSDFSFCKNKNITVVNNSIVTAPHHGSKDNDSAYTKILGSNLTFVRSDQSQKKRPGAGYLGQTLRYCTICRNSSSNSKQKVELTLSNGIFKTTANKCTCQYQAQPVKGNKRMSKKQNTII